MSDNLYTKVEALSVGTIFQVEHGAPWLRTDNGVVDLIPIILPFSVRHQSIPEIWRTYTWRIRVLYGEES